MDHEVNQWYMREASEGTYFEGDKINFDNSLHVNI